jgi:predicted DCC family thiol-disulfide oxidoreductase YuxK
VATSESKLRPNAGAGREPRERQWRVLYDGECGLCKWLLCGLLAWDRRRRLDPLALQRPESGEFLADLAPEERMAVWHLISPEGERQSGGAALAPLLHLLPGGRLPAAAFARLPALTDRSYRWVAEHRSQLSTLVPPRVKQRAHECVRRRERAPAPL